MKILSNFWKVKKGEEIRFCRFSLTSGKYMNKNVLAEIIYFFPQTCIIIYAFIYFRRTLVFGQSGRTKGPLLFFIGSVLLWAYPMYFLRCIPVTWEALPQTHYTFIVINVIMWIRYMRINYLLCMII